jgi:4-hydroxy 2-oxovalerate aldolase
MIKLVCIDFDGVFSDKTYISSDKIITKSVNPKDTYGLKLLKNNNFKIGIVSACDSNIITNFSKIVSRIDFLSQGNYEKLDVIKKWCSELNIELSNVAYIGDDVFDSSFMNLIGFSACPCDSVKECLTAADYICKNKGGDGAVREFIEIIIEHNNSESIKKNINNLNCSSKNKYNMNYLLDNNTVLELLEKYNIYNVSDILNLNKRKNSFNRVEYLDCTIRDGGYLNNWEFTDDEVLSCYKSTSISNYDYFEIGFRTNKDISKNKGKWYYCEESDLINIKSKYSNGCKFAVMCVMNTFTENDFVNKSESQIDLVRLLLSKPKTLENNNLIYNEKQILECVDVIKYLNKKGYEVSLNIACANLITDNEIDFICKYISTNDLKLKSLYLADTYGSFTETNIPITINKFHNKLNKYNPYNNIIFGFHIHNNNEDAIIKYKSSIFNGVGMIDSCINGLGRGAGNLQTEYVIMEKLKSNIEYYKGTLWNLFETGSTICKYSEIFNKDKYFEKYFYSLSSILDIHPDYIKDIINIINITPREKYEVIFKLYYYIQKMKTYSYNSSIINDIK